MGIITWGLRVFERVEDASFSTLWAPQHYLNYLGASLIVTAVEIIGFAVFVIPGIVASAFMLFVPFFVIDRGMNPIEAIQRSFHLTKKHFWSVLLLMFTALIVNVLGAVLAGIGLLITIPVTIVAFAHAYRTLAQMPQVA